MLNYRFAICSWVGYRRLRILRKHRRPMILARLYHSSCRVAIEAMAVISWLTSRMVARSARVRIMP